MLCPPVAHVRCMQLVQEFKLLLIVGRRLVFPAQSSAAVSADLTTQLQFQAADGTTAMRTVSLMFPANCRTVVRLMEASYDAQVSLSMLAGRHFVYIMDGRAAGRGAPLQVVGDYECHTPHEPGLGCCCLVHSCSARYHQQTTSLCWLWLCHAAKASLPPSWHTFNFQALSPQGPARHHSTAAVPRPVTKATLPSSLRTVIKRVGASYPVMLSWQS
jgi:hypothetical protein